MTRLTLIAIALCLAACASSDGTPAGQADAETETGADAAGETGADPEAETGADAEAETGADAEAETGGGDLPVDQMPEQVTEPTGTAEALEAFWGLHGGPEAFPEPYVDAVEALLYAEDEVVAGDYAAARARIDAIFEAMPLSDPIWWSGVGQDGTNVGTPVAYYGLRMLDEVAKVGLGEVPAEPATIRMTVLLVACAEGQQPTTPALDQGKDVSLTLHPDLAKDDHAMIRQSLRLFQHYVWAITGGRLTLELAFEPVAACAQVYFGSDPSVASIANHIAPIEALPQAVRDASDMFWVLYPSNVPTDPAFGDMAFITGGMGGYGPAPVFIIDDLWLVRKPPHLGEGPYTEVERRVYLPQWLQHEYFHHLFARYPEFGLEETGHQWFDKGTWPEDFVGEWEPDYYAEALHKRLLGAEPPLWATLRNAAPAPELLAQVPLEAVLGTYNRLPVENDWHVVTIAQDADGLWWRNDAGVEWQVSYADGVLTWSADSPYGEQALKAELDKDADGAWLPALVGLRTPGGELYSRIGD